MEAGSTLEMEVAENMGEDWEEMVDQRKYEIQRFEELGIPFQAGRRLKDSLQVTNR